MRTSRPALDRMLEKIDASGDCWIWTGALNRGGYGVARGDDGRARIAHRLMRELLVGPNPDGLDLDHLCRVRACVNPDHLQPVGRQTNVDRGAHAAGRPRRDTCANGHPFTPENTKTTKAQARTCRICANARNRAYRLSLKEAS